MAVRMSKFCKFGLLLNAALFCKTPFQQFNELMRHLRGQNAFTVTETCSGFISGSAVDTT